MSLGYKCSESYVENELGLIKLKVSVQILTNGRLSQTECCKSLGSFAGKVLDDFTQNYQSAYDIANLKEQNVAKMSYFTLTWR
jgi:hypothetical protein